MNDRSWIRNAHNFNSIEEKGSTSSIPFQFGVADDFFLENFNPSCYPLQEDSQEFPKNG